MYLSMTYSIRYDKNDDICLPCPIYGLEFSLISLSHRAQK